MLNSDFSNTQLFFLFLLHKSFYVCLRPFSVFFLSLLLKDFGTFHICYISLFEVFLCFFFLIIFIDHFYIYIYIYIYKKNLIIINHFPYILVVAVNFKRQTGIKLRRWGINLTQLLE